MNLITERTPEPIVEYFERHIMPEPNSGCWLWCGAIGGSNNSYGNIMVGGRKGRRWLAHRLSHEIYKGPIPDGLVIDHKCKNTLCVNPDHLEAVDQGENIRRGKGNGNREKTHCPRGHPYDAENTRFSKTGGRDCRICSRAQSYRWYRNQRKKQQMLREIIDA